MRNNCSTIVAKLNASDDLDGNLTTNQRACFNASSLPELFNTLAGWFTLDGRVAAAGIEFR